MNDMEGQIENILNNPQMMEQIRAMAQSLGGTPPSKEPPQENLPNIDPATIQRFSALAKSTGIDKRERDLLQALGAYLSKERIGKLEKAMRAAKMAKLASTALTSSTGR